MSSEDQADAYREEAKLTLESAHSIYETATSGGGNLWAQVVKNAYGRDYSVSVVDYREAQRKLLANWQDHVESYAETHGLPDDE